MGIEEQKVHERYLQLTNVVCTKYSSWTAQEDARLRYLVLKNGAKHWARYSLEFPGRTGKQCRERYNFTLNPTIKKDAWND